MKVARSANDIKAKTSNQSTRSTSVDVSKPKKHINNTPTIDLDGGIILE